MNSIPELIAEIKKGRPVILVDDEDRENEGDLIVAADHINAEHVNFMAKEARGLICLSMTEAQIGQLGLSLMIKDNLNYSPHGTAFTMSIEAATGVTTGISAADRAHTMRVAADKNSGPKDIVVPGHVFPVMAKKGGVLKRAGHTEASVDLAVLAGLNPAAVICEVMNDDGTMARVPDLKNFCEKHQIKIGTIQDLIEYRLETETFVKEVASSQLISHFGNGFDIKVFKNTLDGREHIALIKGEISPEEICLVRVQTECVLGDVFGSTRSNSGSFLQESMRLIEAQGRGVIVYLKSDDMGERLVHQVQSSALFDKGKIQAADLLKEYKSDKKNYGLGAQILRSLGVKKINLLTNNPSIKKVGLKGYGLEIVENTDLKIEWPLDMGHFGPSESFGHTKET